MMSNTLKTTGLLLFAMSIQLHVFAQQIVVSTVDQPWQIQHIKAKKSKTSQATISINDQVNHQIIDGFGGCFNELGYTALQLLDSTEQHKIMSDLFGTAGTSFNLCRMSIGANDFAKNWYSLNETPNDLDMTNFSIARDQDRLIPYIKLAMQYRPDLQIWGSPWSPPIWMKHNRHYGGKATNMYWGPLYGDNMKEIYDNNRFIMEPKYLTAFATYFSKYISAYKNEGINISAVQPQNEAFANQLFPSCVWTAADLHEFTDGYLIPQLANDHPEVEVYYGTLNEDSIAYVDELLANSKAVGVGVQWKGIKTIGQIHDKYPEMKIMQTESECNNGLNNWFTAEHTYDLLYQSFANGANSYMYWNMILDDMGLSTWMWRQNSMITIDRFSKAITYNPEYYVMKHFSHFLPAGSLRVDCQSENNSKALAFKTPDDQLIVMLTNQTEEEVTEIIQVGKKSYSVTLPAHAIATFIN